MVIAWNGDGIEFDVGLGSSVDRGYSGDGVGSDDGNSASGNGFLTSYLLPTKHTNGERQGCDAALETLPADMKAGQKAALMKRAYSTLILCFGDQVLREVTKEAILREVTKETTDDNAYFGEALVVVGNDEMAELVMDSGGSSNMTHRRDFLYNFKVFDGSSVQLGDNRTCTIKGTWKVKIQLHDGSSLTLEDVSTMPGQQDGPRFEVPARGKDAEYRLCLSVTPKVEIVGKLVVNLNIVYGLKCTL
ncbi:hypothetical protein Tco_1237904 [Tanacetum coccineum]